MDKNYKGLIWTNHALSRMRDRGIKQGDAWATFRRSDKSERAKVKGAWVYSKTCGDKKIGVVAKQNEKGKWMVLSVWSRPIYDNRSKPESLWKLIKRKIFS